VAGYCESVGRPSWATGGFWGVEFHSNLDRQMCQQITAIRGEYESVLVEEAQAGRYSSQAAIGARSILQTVDSIDAQLEAGETCLTLGAADPPTALVGAGLFGIAYRIIHRTWAYPQGTDIAYEQICTDWASRLNQLDLDLKQQLVWAGDTGRAETIGSLIDTAENIGLTAANVTNVGPSTWCENAPEVCSAVKTAGWLLVAYIGLQAFKEFR